MTCFMRRMSWLAVAFIAAGWALAGPVYAQKMPPAVAAVIDYQRITREAVAFKNAREQLDKYRAGLQGEVAKDEERLRNEEQELVRQRTVLAPEAFEQRRRDFEKKVTELQRSAQERSRSFEQVYNNVSGDIRKVLAGIVADIGKERGFNIVFDRAMLSYRADNLDITDEVLKRLDQKLPTVKIDLPPAGR